MTSINYFLMATDNQFMIIISIENLFLAYTLTLAPPTRSEAIVLIPPVSVSKVLVL